MRWSREKIRKIQIDFALGNGIYGELVGDVPVDEKLLLKVKGADGEAAGCGNPGQKRSINTDDAVELFGKHGMHDKEQLFQYRRASRVNIYSIGEFEDYFYGYMVPDTSYVKYFDLVPCHAGISAPASGENGSEACGASGDRRSCFDPAFFLPLE